ncbi:hypothetical protein DFH09DRAFT_1132068, partial [Mycena vulgaris]
NWTDGSGNLFIPAYKNFRVIAIAAPVPPFPVCPLDPSFRSRFQARFVDPASSTPSAPSSPSAPPRTPRPRTSRPASEGFCGVSHM